MQSETLSAPAGSTGNDRRDTVAAGSVIASHSLQHAYTQGFYVILPIIYTTLGLSPVAAGALETARRVSSGVASMGGGVLVDQLQHLRVVILYLSLTAMGLGYLIVGLAPTYALIVLAVALAGAAGSLWHPAAISLLSQEYPEKRGFVVSLHRALGNVGDTIGPLVVGGLLLVLSWQNILFAAFPVALTLMVLLWLVLRRASGWRQPALHGGARRPFGEQMRALGDLLRDKALLFLLLVAGMSGLAQGGLLLWLPLYLQETQGMGSVGIGVHVSLLTGVGIITVPVMGILSDRVGRKPMIVIALAAMALVALMMALAGSGLMFTLLVGLMGAFMFGTNSLVQVAALDIGEGRQLEGSLIGLLWGNNALFVGAAPILVGLLVASLGYSFLFWYIAGMSAIAAAVALLLPVAGPVPNRHG